MQGIPKKLQLKLAARLEHGSYRKLPLKISGIDFSSNDYLGFAKSELIFNQVHQELVKRGLKINGSTGSRLLSGNHILYSETEDMLCQFYHSEAALIFNSGYNANLGFFASIPQKGDLILFDELIHASIRDGIQLSNATAFKFKHNDLEHLDKVLKRVKNGSNEIYLVTESVFSMDGDSPDLKKLSAFSKLNDCHLVIDEAHAVGVFGNRGQGMIASLGLEKQVFARIITFGKALGCHGAAILGSQALIDYLINFARSFIYTTALAPHTLATILKVHKEIANCTEIEKLHTNINNFKTTLKRLSLKIKFIESQSAIQSCIIHGNKRVKHVADSLQEAGFNVRPILSPTVPLGFERLRFCIHSKNSFDEIDKVLSHLATFDFK